MVLTLDSPHYLHILQNLALLLTAFLFLPLSIFVLFLSYILHPFLALRHSGIKLPTLLSIPLNRPVVSSTQRLNGDGPPHVLTTASPSYRNLQPSSTRARVLITGVGMTKGLFLARAFHTSHHHVIGADVAPYNLIPPIGRFSRSVDQFYTLPVPTEQFGSAPYIHALLTIIRRERVSLWVSCSGVGTALDDARAKEIISLRSDCTCIQFDVRTTQLLHEKDTFTAHAASLGLPVPETHNVTSRAAVHKVLHQSPRTRKRYIMKSVNMDDASRAGMMTLLPRRTLSETYSHVARLPISEARPWVLQQFVPGKREYCTHALVVGGQVKAFVACPSSELLMHYEALPHPASALSRALLRFTEEFAAKTAEREGSGEGLTGHLSFDFLVDEQVTERGVENVIRAIECNPRAHTAVALFRGREKELVKAYTSALDGGTMTGPNGDMATERREEQQQEQVDSGILDLHPAAAPATPETETETVFPVLKPPKIYWLGHDLITLLLQPLLHLLGLATPMINLPSYLDNVRVCLAHVLLWHDGTYEVWDPLPAWWLYQVYWPGILVGHLVTGRRWSRANVGTCKVFGC